MYSKEDFVRITRRNLAARSRTIKNKKGSTSTSALKLPLRKTGNELVSQLSHNIDAVINCAWESARDRSEPITPRRMEDLCYRWIELINNQLIDQEGYQALRAEHQLEDIHEQHRLWQTSYHPCNPEPGEIGNAVSDFASRLSDRVEYVRTLPKWELADTLAFTDRTIDLIIHPWVDGCGKFATVAVMWVAARMGAPGALPLFQHRTVHYQMIARHSTHRAYLYRCL